MLAKIFACNIYKELEARGWSQQRLARESGVSDNFLNNIMCDNKSCSLKTVAKICDALDIAAHVFLNPEFVSTSEKEPKVRRSGPMMKDPAHAKRTPRKKREDAFASAAMDTDRISPENGVAAK